MKKNLANSIEHRNIIYQSILNNSHDFIAAVDRDFCYVYFNEAYQQEYKKIFGIDLVIGMNAINILEYWPEDQEKVKKIRNRLLTLLKEDVFSIEEDFGDKNLAHPFYEFRYSALLDEKGEIIGFSLIGQNITLRKEAERTIPITNEF